MTSVNVLQGIGYYCAALLGVLIRVPAASQQQSRKKHMAGALQSCVLGGNRRATLLLYFVYKKGFNAQPRATERRIMAAGGEPSGLMSLRWVRRMRVRD